MVGTEPDEDDLTIGIDFGERRGAYLSKRLYRITVDFGDLSYGIACREDATEAGGNQTITEGGVFCTQPIQRADCQKAD